MFCMETHSKNLSMRCKRKNVSKNIHLYYYKKNNDQAGKTLKRYKFKTFKSVFDEKIIGSKIVLYMFSNPLKMTFLRLFHLAIVIKN